MNKKSYRNYILGTSKLESITAYLGPFLRLVRTWLLSQVTYLAKATSRKHDAKY